MDTGSAVSSSKAGRTGLVTLLAGLGFVLGGGLDATWEWSWLFLLAGFALLLYAVPQLHRHQAPSDGGVGLWGSRLFVFGTTIVVLLGAFFAIWEAIGTSGEPAWANLIWPIGFFSLLAGFMLFVIGSLKARVLDPLGLTLVLVGFIGGVILDMATGAFFEDNGETTEWGFFIGVPLAGLGLMWLGYKLRSERGAAASATE